MIQSRPVIRGAGRARRAGRSSASTIADHPDASSDADLARIDDALAGARPTSRPARGRARRAGCAACCRSAADRRSGRWTPAEHRRPATPSARTRSALDGRARLVLRARRRAQSPRRAARQGADGAASPRRHAAQRPGHAARRRATLCATGWMHGVFAAQLTIGNTSFHKLFSVSRDPYNITRASGLRILVDDRRRLAAARRALGLRDRPQRLPLDLPARRTGPSPCRRSPRATTPAMQWRIEVEGEPCRFLVFGHLVLGERELDHAGRVEIDARRASASPSAPTRPRCGASAIRTPSIISSPARPMRSRRSAATSCSMPTARAAAAPTSPCGRGATSELGFAVVGSLTDPRRGGAAGGAVRTTASTTRRCWRRPRATGRR